MAPGKLVPLHSHADPECFYLLQSEIEVCVVDRSPKWRTVEELKNWAPPATAPLGEGSTWAVLLIGFAGIGLFSYPQSLRKYLWEAAMAENDLRYRNARLRRKIDGALKNRPELEAVVDGITRKQSTNASLEQVQANLQERARAIIEAKPELDGYFDA